MLKLYLAQKKIENEIRKVFDNSKDIVLDIGSGKNPYYHEKVKGSIIKCDLNGKNPIDIQGSAESLPFKKESFDKIISINALYYASDPKKTFDEILRVLKKNGTLLIVSPFIYPIHDAPNDKYRFSEFAYRVLLEKECREIMIKPIGGIFTLPLVFLRSIIKGIPLLFPKKLRKMAMILLFIVLLPLYVLAQILTFLDVLDKTRRWPTYYLVIAHKK